MTLKIGTVVEMTRDAPDWISMIKGDIGIIVERGCEDNSYLIESFVDNMTWSISASDIKIYRYQSGEKVRIISERSKYNGRYATVHSSNQHENVIKLYIEGSIYSPQNDSWNGVHKTLGLAIQSVIPISTNSHWRQVIDANDINNNKIVKEGEKSSMAKLTGFKKVAVIEYRPIGTDLHYALYDDLGVGDQVLVSGQLKNQILKIKRIMTPEEAKVEFSKNILEEVICKVDTSAYDQRVKNRAAAEKLRKEMDKKIADLQEMNKYALYAEKDAELAKMLEEYNELI